MEKLNKLFEQKYGAIRGAQTKLANDLGIGQSTVACWISGTYFFIGPKKPLTVYRLYAILLI